MRSISTPEARALARLAGFLRRLQADRGGNVLIIVALAIIPLTFVSGFAVDYARAMKLQTQLNAAADAAALAAVSPAMILQSNSASQEAATKMFNAQAARLTGYRNLVVTPVITDGTSSSSGALGYLRKAKVSYTVQSVNLFGDLLGRPTLSLSGSAAASAAQPPNVDFYLAMDNSPSMLLPATSDGMAKIIAATKTSQLANGCAFACHAQIPHSDNVYVNDPSGKQVLLSTGFYGTGSTSGVYYRWDTSASKLYDSQSNLMNSTSNSVSGPVRTTSGSGNNTVNIDTTTTTTTAVTYSIVDSTSAAVTIKKSTTTTTSTRVYKTKASDGSFVSDNTTNGTPSTSTSTFDTGYWADGYWLTHNYGALYGSPSSIVLRKDDVVSAATQLIPFAASQAAQYNVTYQAQLFSFDWTRSGGTSPVRTLNSLGNVANYGSGFSAASVFPADDYWYKNNAPTSSQNINDQATEMTNMLTFMKNLIPTAGTGAPGATPQKILFLITDGMADQPSGSSRYFGPLSSSDLTQCTAIKAKGIKIAVLYTQYLPESLVGDSWSQSNVAPFLPPPPSPYPAGNAGSTDQVLTALKSCASPGINGTPLVQTVTSDGDISTALQQLFSTALQTARLVN
jgi:Flp pilus assembly protein TadG